MAEPKRATTAAEIFTKFENFQTSEGETYGMTYQPDPTDIFIVTPSKCGTTWMQQIVHGLRTRGSMDFDEITAVVPWIEMAFDMGIDIYKPQKAHPRAFKTHNTLSEIPKGGKYICVVRDPADAMLSLYRFFEGWIFEKGSISPDEFALDFYLNSDGRNYWRHITSLWERRQEKDVLGLCYENIKQNLPSTVEDLAKFMEIELDTELKEIVVRQSDIKFMSEHDRKFDDHIVRETRDAACGLPPDGVTSKVKTGVVGEAKAHISPQIMDLFDKVWRKEVAETTGWDSYEELKRDLAN